MPPNLPQNLPRAAPLRLWQRAGGAELHRSGCARRQHSAICHKAERGLESLEVCVVLPKVGVRLSPALPGTSHRLLLLRGAGAVLPWVPFAQLLGQTPAVPRTGQVKDGFALKAQR